MGLPIRYRLAFWRDAAISAGPFILLTAGLLWLAYSWLEPNPPGRVVLATGPDQSAYEAFGKRYATELARYGIRVELLATEGSADNLQALREGRADLGFVQGGSGTPDAADTERLQTLGRLFVAPVWIFYREDTARRRLGQPVVSTLPELKGWRVNVGTRGSGVPQLFEQLMAANRLAPRAIALSYQAHTPATVDLLEGRIDALVFAEAPESLLVQMLLQTPGIRLMGFAQSEAYARRLGFLQPVVLSHGVVDLASDRPAQDVRLVAATSSLVARESSHPAILQLFAQAAETLHSPAGWFNGVRAFPSIEGTELPVAPEAERLHRNGTPLLQRYLPFWMANLIERMWLAMGLIIALALPLSRIVPPLYTLRVRSRVYRWYADLRELEARAEQPGAARAALLADLDRLERQADRVQVPLAYAEELYALRQHIELVRQRVQRLG